MVTRVDGSQRRMDDAQTPSSPWGPRATRMPVRPLTELLNMSMARMSVKKETGSQDRSLEEKDGCDSRRHVGTESEESMDEDSMEECRNHHKDSLRTGSRMTGCK